MAYTAAIFIVLGAYWVSGVAGVLLSLTGAVAGYTLMQGSGDYWALAGAVTGSLIGAMAGWLVRRNGVSASR